VKLIMARVCQECSVLLCLWLARLVRSVSTRRANRKHNV